MVTGPLPVNEVGSVFWARKNVWADAGPVSVRTLGDALGPGLLPPPFSPADAALWYTGYMS
jgi:hypothetical protein